MKDKFFKDIHSLNIIKMGLFKRKKVPTELPELALDEFDKENKEVHDFLKQEGTKTTVPQTAPATPVVPTTAPAPVKKVETTHAPAPTTTFEKPVVESKETTPVVQEPVVETKPAIQEVVEPVSEQKQEIKAPVEDKSFFANIQNNLNEQIQDFNELEEWYKDKFEKRDVIKEMKDYWEGQKAASVIKILGKSFQERIEKKIVKLQELEKNWQNVYFDLIEKEEQIKEEEIELKDLLGEFVKLCKAKAEEAQKTKVSDKKSTESTSGDKDKQKKTFKKLLKNQKKSSFKKQKPENEKTKKTN